MNKKELAMLIVSILVIGGRQSAVIYFLLCEYLSVIFYRGLLAPEEGSVYD